MGINRFVVVFESDQAVYSSGQDVAGFVELFVESIMACRAILVKARGFGKVNYLGSENEETYMLETVTVWCGSSQGENLQPGTHMFPFRFKVPQRVPSSYESTYGHIRYMVEAMAEIPWGENVTTQKDFKVDSRYDLIQDEDASLPLRFVKEESVCCCCCEQGPVNIALTAEKTGYIPGEYILLTGEVTNRAGWHIENSVIKLIQTIKYKVENDSHQEIETIQRLGRPGILAGDTDVWLSVPLRIPEMAACLQYCNIMKAKYEVEITFCMGFCSDAMVKEDIIVGSSPVGKVTMALEGLVPSPSAPKPSAPPLYNSTEPISQELKPVITQQPTATCDTSPTAI
ncbi:arrestin domain-containing protein 3-like [Penaeus japonicus]|uniref:arrestin domain-containing protein 3-like n=1 Tax=Penaeus japonicus TaxID=27405 RepID=UPI001C70B7AE|nr:arrestin domain-containing protein 3-like [Penaeus japonicus]